MLLARLHDGVVVLYRLLLAVGQRAGPHAPPAHLLGHELGLGDAGVKLLLGLSSHYHRVGVSGGLTQDSLFKRISIFKYLLEECQIWTQSPDILVNL